MNFRLALFSAALHKGKMNAHVILLNRALGCGHQPQKVQGIGRETVGDSHYDPKFGCHSITLPLEAYEKIAKPLAATFGPLRTWEVHFVAELVPEPVRVFWDGFAAGRAGASLRDEGPPIWNEGVLFGMLFEPNAQAELMIAKEGARMREALSHSADILDPQKMPDEGSPDSLGEIIQRTTESLLAEDLERSGNEFDDIQARELPPVDAKTPFFLLRKIAKEEGLDIESADWKDADNAGRAAAIIANRQRKTEHASLVEATA